MNMQKLNNVYISSGCNQCTNALHWGRNNLICFAACNSVGIYCPEFGSGGRIIATLSKHTGQVNSVRWLTGSDISTEHEIVSGSTDKSVIVWTIHSQNFCSEVLLGHSANVVIVDGLYKGLNKSNAVIVSACMDGIVKVWFRRDPSEKFFHRENIDFGYNICIAMRLFNFEPSNNQLILAVSLDDSSIKLYVEERQLFYFSVSLKRHEDWVCGLDFKKDGDDTLLASSSQDTLLRIWRITKQQKHQFEDYKLTTLKWSYNIYLDSVQAGHEGWVYSVSWNPLYNSLLSSSMDKTMVVWEYDAETALWLENIRVGEMGGNTLGFYGGVFGPTGESMIGYGYNGAFHLWKNDVDDWIPLVQVGGHFKSVSDIAWEPNGSYLFSVSSDQTCRIHAPWSTDGKSITWHEIARPQVHGYDMNAITVFSKYAFASASEEKVIRIFSAPKNFIDNYRRICKVQEDPSEIVEMIIDTCPKGASVPSLGLSNKAVYAEDNNEQSELKNSKEMYPEESHFSAIELDNPPTEETLIQNTLWPETRKLYGHGYEVYCLAASPDGKYLASACKSTTQEHASILLWNTTNWKQLQKLVSHTLTITQISFSPDSQRILTVSRDRRWSVFEKKGEEQFTLSATTNKATGLHTRVIWCCAWTYDSKYFATGSRDGKLAIWTKNHQKQPENILGQYELVSSPLVLPEESITAVDVGPCLIDGKYIFAVGFESGRLSFFLWTNESYEPVLELNQSVAHHLTVKRIKFRPILGQAGHKEVDENILQVASCSADNSVKIHSLLLNKLLLPEA